MPFLYQISLGEIKGKALLTSQKEVVSLIYHDLFGFPLTAGELIKWVVGEKVKIANWRQRQIEVKNGYYFLKDNEGAVYRRLLRKRISQRKIALAKRAAKFLALIPTVEMVAITGALAMENAAEESDIDLMIITKANTLWATRLLVYFVLGTLHFALRRPQDKHQRDKLCLNLWLDEKALSWNSHDRNIYTAHEIAQIKPLVNKNKAYEKFLAKNQWIFEYWPNSVRIKNNDLRFMNKKRRKSIFNIQYSIFKLIEKIAFSLQYFYMKSKITREVVTPHKALFHPHDWGKVVLARFSP